MSSINIYYLVSTWQYKTRSLVHELEVIDSRTRHTVRYRAWRTELHYTSLNYCTTHLPLSGTSGCGVLAVSSLSLAASSACMRCRKEACLFCSRCSGSGPFQPAGGVGRDSHTVLARWAASRASRRARSLSTSAAIASGSASRRQRWQFRTSSRHWEQSVISPWMKYWWKRPLGRRHSFSSAWNCSQARTSQASAGRDSKWDTSVAMSASLDMVVGLSASAGAALGFHNPVPSFVDDRQSGEANNLQVVTGGLPRRRKL